jgi:maleylpyruvate isomerase
VRAVAQIVACDIHPINNLRVLQWLRGPARQPEEQVQEWTRHWIIEGFTAIESLLGADRDQFCFGQFCFENSISLAEVCLVPQVIAARNLSVDLAPFPRICRASEAALALPEFHDALPQEQEDFE